MNSRTCMVCREKRELLEDEYICSDCHQRLSVIARTLRRFSHQERDGKLPAAELTSVGTAPVLFPEELRRQLKMLAAEEGRPIVSMVGEAFNLLFAKYGKAETVPVKGLEPPVRLPEPRLLRTSRNLQMITAAAEEHSFAFDDLLQHVLNALAEGRAKER
jgi:hypothetical protein